ncbi:hypothetical protein ACP4OV_012474 [Aristida adscensionis]
MAASLRFAVAVTCALALASTCQGLQVGYYKKTCPRAEAIVRDEVKKFVYKNTGIGAGLVRLLFHNCLGCDGSVLLDPTPANPQPEKLSPPNFPSLRGFEVIDAAKDAVEKASQCPGKGRDQHARRPPQRARLQRLRGPRQPAAAVLQHHRPHRQLRHQGPRRRGHGRALRRAHRRPLSLLQCSSFVPDRLAVASDIDAGFANVLRRRCLANPTTRNDPTVNQDFVTPYALDNQYYKNVLAHKVLFASDAALITTPMTAKMVRDNSYIPGPRVKTGKQGEIRKHCRVVNRAQPRPHHY